MKLKDIVRIGVASVTLILAADSCIGARRLRQEAAAARENGVLLAGAKDDPRSERARRPDIDVLVRIFDSQADEFERRFEYQRLKAAFLFGLFFLVLALRNLFGESDSKHA